MTQSKKWSEILSRKILPVLLGLYFFCSLVSMAGMEISSSLIVLATLPLIFFTPLFANLDCKTKALVLSAVPFAAVTLLIQPFVPSLSTDQFLYTLGDLRWTLIFAVVGLAVLASGINAKVLLKSLAIAALVLGAYSVIQAWTGIDIFRSAPYEKTTFNHMWRAKGFFSNTMTYSYAIGMAFCYLVGSYYTDAFKEAGQRGWRLLVVFSCLVMGASLIHTFTRGLWLSLIAVFIAMTLSSLKRRHILTLIAGMVLAAAVFSGNKNINMRMSGAMDPSQLDFSSSNRIMLFKANWNMFLDHPLTGVGYGQSTNYLPEHFERLNADYLFISHAHNNYLSVLGEIGLFGFLAYMFFFGLTGWMHLQLWKRRHSYSTVEQSLILGGVGSFLVFHLGGLSECTYLDGEVVHMLMITTAISIFLFHKGASKHATAN